VMSELKPTPGPWKLGPSFGSSEFVESADGKVIADCGRRPSHGISDAQERLANRLVICAARDLLAACKYAERAYSGVHHFFKEGGARRIAMEAHQRLQSAIAKTQFVEETEE